MNHLEHIWKTISEGGDVIYFLLAIALVGTAFCIYCSLFLRKKILLPRELVDIANTANCNSDFELTEGKLKKAGGPLADILYSVMTSRDYSIDEADTLIEVAGKRVAHLLNRGVVALEVIAAISPLLGLLGTVTGMYTVFDKIAHVGANEVGQLSGGIAEALVTTIAGLIVGIPSYVAYSYFTRKSDQYLMEMERLAIGLMHRIR